MTAEWRHVCARFHGFITNLLPTERERAVAAAAAAEVAACLRARFRPLDGLLFGGFAGGGDSDYLVIGGHGKGTAIRPAVALDMLYVLPPPLRRGDRRTTKGTPTVEDLTAALSERFAAVGFIGEGWFAIRSAAGPAVRLIPGFPRRGSEHTLDRGFRIGVSSGPGAGGEARFTNPLAEVACLREADRLSGHKATHLILMLKAWRRQHAVPIGAFALELLVSDFVRAWTYHRRSLLFYDWMVRDFFFWLGYQDGRTLEIPGTANRLNLDDAWSAKAAAAFICAEAGCRLERDNRDDQAIERWREIFGPAISEDADAAVGGAARLAAPEPQSSTAAG